MILPFTGIAATLLNEPWPFVQNSPLDSRLHKKFEENWPRLPEEVVQICGRTDGWRVITIAHFEASAHVS